MVVNNISWRTSNIVTLMITRNKADRESAHSIPTINNSSKLATFTSNNTTHGQDKVSSAIADKFTEGGIVKVKANQPYLFDLNNNESNKKNTSALSGEEGLPKSSIKPRKGVNYALNETVPEKSTSTDKSMPLNRVTATKLPVNRVTATELPVHVQNKTTHSNNSVANLEPHHQQTDITSKIHNVTTSSTTPPPKKPELTNLDDDVNFPSEVAVKSTNTSSRGGRPDLVLPVVITLFALPLFATLGYFALKHGREAWKNRHYRRMDFLLDGMYND